MPPTFQSPVSLQHTKTQDVRVQYDLGSPWTASQMGYKCRWLASKSPCVLVDWTNQKPHDVDPWHHKVTWILQHPPRYSMGYSILVMYLLNMSYIPISCWYLYALKISSWCKQIASPFAVFLGAKQLGDSLTTRGIQLTGTPAHQSRNWCFFCSFKSLFTWRSSYMLYRFSKENIWQY